MFPCIFHQNGGFSMAMLVYRWQNGGKLCGKCHSMSELLIFSSPAGREDMICNKGRPQCMGPQSHHDTSLWTKFLLPIWVWAQASGRHALEHSSVISSQSTAFTHDVLGLHVCSFGWRHGTEPPSECWRLSSLFVQTYRHQKCGVSDVPWLARFSKKTNGWMDETETNSLKNSGKLGIPSFEARQRIPPAWESVLGLIGPPNGTDMGKNIWRYYPYHPWDWYIYPAIYLLKIGQIWPNVGKYTIHGCYGLVGFTSFDILHP